MSEIVSLPVRRLAAVGLLLGLILAVFLYILAPAAERIGRLDTEIEAKRVLLGRLAGWHARGPSAIDAASRSEAALAAEIGLAGETEPIRMANMQAAIRAMAEEAGARLQSTRTLPPLEREQVRLGGLQISLRAPIETIQRLVHRIEASRPLLVVDGLEIVPIPAGSTGGPTGERLLQIDMRVLAFLGPVRKGSEP